MTKRKNSGEKSCEETKNTKLNLRSGYNVMQEHNYFHSFEKKKCRWPDENEKSNYTEMKIINDYDNYDSVPDWCIARNSSDEEDDIEDMPLSYILIKEFEKDLLHERKNKKCTNDLLLFNEDQIYKELNNINNHDLLNISNGSSSIIGENHLINDGKQSKVMQILPLANDAIIIQNQNITNGTEIQTCNQSHMKLIVKNNFKHNDLLSNAPMNIKARKNVYDNNLQNYLLSSSSLHLSNSLLVRKACPSYNNGEFTTTDTSTNNVCPPLHWIHLIYLAIKNSARENVTCYDIQRSVRCWFPYYCVRSYVKFIHVILSHINHNCQKYFHCNSFTATTIHQDDSWTINSLYINTLEESLMKIVENNENEIKSAMAHPDQLSTILNGYGILFLGCSQDSIKN